MQIQGYLCRMSYTGSQEGARMSCNINIRRQHVSVFLEFLLYHNLGATHANIRSGVCVCVQTVPFHNYRLRSSHRLVTVTISD
jgi:hypothetical protein